VAEVERLVVERVVQNSNAMQFWASEQYPRGIGLYAEESYMVNRKRSGFTAGQMAAYLRKAQRLNREGRGDRGVRYLRHR
jgi:hypothetical protein